MKSKTITQARRWMPLPLVLLAMAAYAQVGCFPKDSESESPDRRFVVSTTGGASAEFEDRLYQLSLTDTHTHRTRQVHLYERACDIAWSPDSRKFVLNNNDLSDMTLNYIVYLRPRFRMVELQPDLHARFTPEDAALLHQMDHLYTSAGRWSSPDTFDTLTWGHGQPSHNGPVIQMCVAYRYTIAGPVRRCRLQGMLPRGEEESKCRIEAFDCNSREP